jgi:hypothetical protein
MSGGAGSLGQRGPGPVARADRPALAAAGPSEERAG